MCGTAYAHGSGRNAATFASRACQGFKHIDLSCPVTTSDGALPTRQLIPFVMFGMAAGGAPDLSKMVLREFRMSSITLKRDALDAIVSVIKR